MSQASRAKLSTSLKAAAARRKAAGIKTHHKPMTAEQKQKLVARLKASAAKRKAMGIHRHLTPVQKQKLVQRLKAAAARRKALGIKHHMSASQKAKLVARMRSPAMRAKVQAGLNKWRHSAAGKAKMHSMAKARWAKMDPTKKAKIIKYLISKSH